MVQNTRRTHGGIIKLQTQIMEQEVPTTPVSLTINQLCIQNGPEASSPTTQLKQGDLSLHQSHSMELYDYFVSRNKALDHLKLFSGLG